MASTEDDFTIHKHENIQKRQKRGKGRSVEVGEPCPYPPWIDLRSASSTFTMS
jgi:hypothetical protein